MNKKFVFELVTVTSAQGGWVSEASQTLEVDDGGFSPVRANVVKSVVDGFVERNDSGDVVSCGDITSRLMAADCIDDGRIRDVLSKVMVFLGRVGVKVGYDAFDLERARSLKVLDLGCGNDRSFYRGRFSPWLCRALYVLGVDVTGVDIHFPKNENGKDVVEDWKFEQLDLKKRGALEVFDKNSFDVVNMKDVLGHRDSELATDPHLFFGEMYPSFYDPDYQGCESEIFRQVLRILKPGGLFLVNDVKYKKVGETVFFRFEDVSDCEDKVMLPYVHVDDSFVI